MKKRMICTLGLSSLLLTGCFWLSNTCTKKEWEEIREMGTIESFLLHLESDIFELRMQVNREYTETKIDTAKTIANCIAEMDYTLISREELKENARSNDSDRLGYHNIVYESYSFYLFKNVDYFFVEIYYSLQTLFDCSEQNFYLVSVADGEKLFSLGLSYYQ